jgi:hypothetical protein
VYGYLPTGLVGWFIEWVRDRCTIRSIQNNNYELQGISPKHLLPLHSAVCILPDPC